MEDLLKTIREHAEAINKHSEPGIERNSSAAILVAIAQLEAMVTEPDSYCITTPDGGCSSTDPRCMHQPKTPWQPIETAPTEPVAQYLVYTPGDRSRYDVCRNMNDFRIIGNTFDFDLATQPTMWMPIIPA